MKLKNLNLLLICLLLLNHCVYAQPNIVEQLRELHKKKSQGLITEKEFEQQKNKITESNSPAAKKKEAEKSRAAAEKKKQEQILAEKLRLETEKKNAEAKVLAAKEYDVKFPLHAAVKSKDKTKLQKLLKTPDLQINAFDDQGATAWDLAYKTEDPTISFDFCNLLKGAGGASSKDIKKFADEKAKAHLVSLKVSAGVSYRMGGYQPVVGKRMVLLKATDKDKIFNTIQQDIGIVNWHLTSLEMPDVYIQLAANERLSSPIESYVNSSLVAKELTTNANGKVIFEELEPGRYIILFAGPTRTATGFVFWFKEIECKEKETELQLTNDNALAIN